MTAPQGRGADSVYGAYRGYPQVRVMDGVVKPGDKIQLMSNGKTL